MRDAITTVRISIKSFIIVNNTFISKIKLLIMISMILFASAGYAQNKPTNANIVGHVVDAENGEHLPYATVQIKGTTIGVVTDETGHFQLININEGKHILKAGYIGYKDREIEVEIIKNETKIINFSLEKDHLGLDEVVVTASRTEQKRADVPVIVNTLTPKLFETTQSVTLSEGLNYTPGLRLENNCQNCGFSQVRMNGLDGPYSQILINSRPVFSNLAGVYGLELIPANMIERVEVVRGGGSALYGGNAIAGTVNILLKDPKTNTFEGGSSLSMIGTGYSGSALDYSINFNTSLVSYSFQSGLALYGFTRDRQMFDANGDGYSEIAPLKNLTFGGRAYHRFSHRDKLAIDFFVINENRNGGNKQDYPLHERNIAESVSHDLKVAGITYDRFLRSNDMLSFYVSGQFLNRDSYYGAGKSLKDYGNTIDNTVNAGIQYYMSLFDISSLTVGVDNTCSFLIDKKLGYPDLENYEINLEDSTLIINHTENSIVSNQALITTGAFAQYEVNFNKFRLSGGLRYDHYEVKDFTKEGNGSKTGNVLSPRLGIMYDVLRFLQLRASYSQGYRAPQIFDEDLHIETSGSRKVIHVNSPDLKQETSHSFMLSGDLNIHIGKVNTGILVEAFHTTLRDAFSNEYSEPDENGTVIYTRINSKGNAVVKGVNLEIKMNPLNNITFISGFTVQSSKYDEPQDEFNERRFFRTPDNYGYFTFDWDVAKYLCVSLTGNYIGKMIVPYYGTENPDGELRISDPFFDAGAKVSYTFIINDINIETSMGIRNIFNSYQNDFDVSEFRDPAYIYGPSLPRTVTFSIKFGLY